MTRIQVEKEIKVLEEKLLKEKNEKRREILRGKLSYLITKAVMMAEREYREDVIDDYRFRQW